MPTKTIETFDQIVALEALRPELAVLIPLTVKDGHTCLRGDVLGVITSGGLARPRPRSVVATTAFATNSPAGAVAAGTGRLFVVGDVLKAAVGVAQVETATVAGTIGGSGAGNATVVVTAAGMSNSPKTVSVPVANNDTAAIVAAKIRAALSADSDVSTFFAVSGTGVFVILTARTASANDGTMNVSVDNGTCTGLTTAASSANTTPGYAAGTTIGTVLSVLVDAITLTGNAAIAVGIGAGVYVGDGSQVAAAIAQDAVDGDGDTPVACFISGLLLEAVLTGLDATAKTELGGVSVAGGIFKF
jgi:hypothetical protein